MKHVIKYTYLLPVIFFGLSTLYAQDKGSAEYSERISLFTDRGMYVSGEKVLFTACAFNPSHPDETAISKVLYCELITPDGSSIAGGKYPLEQSKCKGCMEIPGETVSGIYYLKAYTRFMRNEGPAAYHFTKLVIINPVKSEVLPSSDNDTVIQHTGYENKADTGGFFTLSTDKSIYSRREKVLLSIADNFSHADSCRILCLSVVPELSAADRIQPVSSTLPESDDVYFYPEIRGITLTGRLQEKSSGLPLPGKKVNLSIIGDKDFMAMRTDSAGRFFFNLNGYSDNWDIFMCSEKVPGSDPVLLVDNDFCTHQPDLPSPPLRLTEPEKRTALDLAWNYQVSKHFRNDSMADPVVEPVDRLSFYGNPTRVLLLDKYIELPTLEEYFNELPNEVKVRNAHNQKYFRFFSTQTEMVIYDPLVLIDWVAVDDIDLVLSLSPRDISRIEMFNAPYLKGQIMYGGIISFISNNNDFAGIDLPASGTFINYSFCNTCDEDLDELTGTENLPDDRNTIYWDPEIVINPNGRSAVSFTTPDTPGIYLILLRGTDLKGNEYSSFARIEIM